MPLTPSHAVVALAFLRTPIAPAAVAVGAMTPDLPLFLRGTPLGYDTTHTWVGLPITVAVALVLLLVWRGMLRPAARELAPRWLAERLPPEWDTGPDRGIRESFSVRGSPHPSLVGSALLILGLAIGVASHVLWDPFTHEGRWGSEALPALAAAWGPLPGFKWLQYGCSLLGLLALALAGWLWLRGKTATPVTRVLPDWVRVLCWVSLPVLLAVAAVLGYGMWGPLSPEFTVAHLAYRVGPPVCAGWATACLVLATTIPFRRR